MTRISTIAELIERLEGVRADIEPASLEAFAEVGWATRPLDDLLERAREEADALGGGKPVLVLRPLAKCGGKR